jgi:hypothetical protein
LVKIKTGCLGFEQHSKDFKEYIRAVRKKQQYP